MTKNSSRRSVFLGMAAFAAGGLGVTAWRRFDLGGKLFNPFSAGHFDLPPVPGLTDAAGAPVPGFSAADIAGKAVFLNAFASWCPQCRGEHQALLDFAGSGATIYGVASLDDPENTLKYLQDFGNPFVRVGVDRNGWLSRALGVRGVPASFVMAPAPRLAFKHPGPMTLAQLQAQIPRALAASEIGGS